MSYAWAAPGHTRRVVREHLERCVDIGLRVTRPGLPLGRARLRQGERDCRRRLLSGLAEPVAAFPDGCAATRLRDLRPAAPDDRRRWLRAQPSIERATGSAARERGDPEQPELRKRPTADEERRARAPRGI